MASGGATRTPALEPHAARGADAAAEVVDQRPCRARETAAAPLRAPTAERDRSTAGVPSVAMARLPSRASADQRARRSRKYLAPQPAEAAARFAAPAARPVSRRPLARARAAGPRPARSPPDATARELEESPGGAGSPPVPSVDPPRVRLTRRHRLRKARDPDRPGWPENSGRPRANASPADHSRMHIYTRNFDSERVVPYRCESKRDIMY